MALDRDKQTLRVLRQIVRLTQQPGTFGKLEIDFQDSTPTYTRFTQGQRVDELPDAEVDLVRLVTQIRQEEENGANHQAR